MLVIFPIGGATAFAVLAWAAVRRDGRLPFAMACLIFIAAFATLAVSFLPYMIPFSVTIETAAAPESSLNFMFWGAGVFVLPLTVIYTIAVYFIFRGKIDKDPQYH